jgi:putative phage-type endonuclease
MLTASDIATALGINPYESPDDLIYMMCGFRRKQTTECTDYGTRLEPEARDKYCELTGESVFEIGLVPHPKFPWLGGSPDGITDSGKLIEIKCPPKREITPTVPKYYIPQVQLLMEILDLEECDFVQYRPASEGRPQVLTISKVLRDREWFAESVPVLERFWNRVIERRKQPLWEGP